MLAKFSLLRYFLFFFSCFRIVRAYHENVSSNSQLVSTASVCMLAFELNYRLMSQWIAFKTKELKSAYFRFRQMNVYGTWFSKINIYKEVLSLAETNYTIWITIYSKTSSATNSLKRHEIIIEISR